MLEVNGSAPGRLASAWSLRRRRTAAFIAPKPIVGKRQTFNAIAATILAPRPNRAELGSRLWITKHGIS